MIDLRVSQKSGKSVPWNYQNESQISQTVNSNSGYCKDIAILLLWIIQQCLIILINNDNINLWSNISEKVSCSK